MRPAVPVPAIPSPLADDGRRESGGRIAIERRGADDPGVVHGHETDRQPVAVASRGQVGARIAGAGLTVVAGPLGFVPCDQLFDEPGVVGQ